MLASHPAATMLMEYPGFLQVWYLDLHLYIYVSSGVWLDSDEIAPALDLAAGFGGVLASSVVVSDRDMMGAEAHLFVFNVARAPEPRTQTEELQLAS